MSISSVRPGDLALTFSSSPTSLYYSFKKSSFLPHYNRTCVKEFDYKSQICRLSMNCIDANILPFSLDAWRLSEYLFPKSFPLVCPLSSVNANLISKSILQSPSPVGTYPWNRFSSTGIFSRPFVRRPAKARNQGGHQHEDVAVYTKNIVFQDPIYCTTYWIVD